MPGGGAISGTAAAGAWVNGAGRFGMEAGPEGGARLIACPPGASGTAAGGTGGGRSPNNCAEAVYGNMTSNATGAGRSHRREPVLNRCLPPKIMAPVFPRKRGKFKPPDPLMIPPGTGKARPAGCNVAVQ